MSRHGEIALPFGPEERTFRLGIDELRKVQEKCDAGPGELLQRLAPIVRAIQARLTFQQMLANNLLGAWRIDDIREVILQGLIGGGETPTMAGVIMRAEFDPKVSWTFAPVAFLILEASLSQVEDEPSLGEIRAAKRKPSRRSPKARSASPTSTAPGP